VKIRLLRPPPIKVTIAAEVVRVDLLREIGAGPDDGGSIAAFVGGSGTGHYLLSEPVPTFANLKADWATGFVPPMGISTELDRIIGGLIEQGVAQVIPER
jgi:hypothetical protein